jgi:1-acyl-sn-glycerol-3-phosphate acyltransferase
LSRECVLSSFNHAWRWLATGISFATFGLGALLFGLLLTPVAMMAALTPWGRKPATQRMIRRQIGRAMGFFVWLMHALGVLDYRISDAESTSAEGPLLILANHPSLIDVVFLLAMFPESQCVVKRALWHNPFTHFIMRSSGYISNSDPAEILVKGLSSLERGNTLILFPEGTRSVPGEPLKFMAGAATMAVRSGCDILPVLIQVSPTTLTKADRWYQVPASKVLIQLQVLPRRRPDAAMLTEFGQRQGARVFNQELQDWFETELAKASEC